MTKDNFCAQVRARQGVDEPDLMLEAPPQVFHTTPHYNGYPGAIATLALFDAAQGVALLNRRRREIMPRKVVAS